MQRINHHMFAAADRQKSILKSRLSLTSLLGIFLDPVVIISSLAAITYAFDEPFGAPYVVLSLVVFSLSFPGKSQLNVSTGAMYRDIVISWLTLTAVVLFFGYASGYLEMFPKNVAVVWFIATPIVRLVAHHTLRIAIPRLLSLRANYRTSVIVGANDQGLELARKIADDPYLGIRFVGFFDDRSRQRLGDIGENPLLGSMRTLAQHVRMHHIDNIYLSLPMVTQPRILHLLDDLRDTTASIYFLPDIFVTDLIQARMDDVSGMPVVAICETPFTGINGVVKRTSDLLMALIILVIIAPLMLAIAICVKLSSPGPIIFKQRRYGLDGKQIRVYKFRTMTVCEDGTNVAQATKNDMRVTRVGTFLRKTSLDELPQFFNVLQGRMSIVGPRPHAIAHNETYRKLIKGYMIRHKVKPGITGLAQVSGFRGETDTLDKMKGRIDQDLAYLRNWSLRLDIQIVLRTVAMLLFGDCNAY